MKLLATALTLAMSLALLGCPDEGAKSDPSKAASSAKPATTTTASAAAPAAPGTGGW